MGNNFASINIPGIVAGVLALVGIFTPWWGVSVSGFGATTSITYGLLSSSGQSGQQVNNNFNQIMMTYTPIILALVLTTVALTLLGSFTPSARPTGAGLFFAITSLVGYSALVSYALTQNCQGNGCINSLTGSSSFLNIRVEWGFQIGFYIFLAATISTIAALAYHQITRRAKTASTK